MRLVYFDECKYHPPSQRYYWLGAISIDAGKIPEIEKLVNELAREMFGTQQLSRETEFHAKDIMHRKRQFADWSIDKRIDCLERLSKIVGDQELVRRIYVRIDPSKMLRDHGWETDAFMFLIEKIQQDASGLGDHCVLIGDLDGEFSEGSVANLSRFREEGTDFQFGKKVDRIIDSVYFIPSHHSRMLQLADIYTYSLQIAAGPDDGNYPRKRLKAYLENEAGLLRANRYKEWPTDFSWYAHRRAA